MLDRTVPYLVSPVLVSIWQGLVAVTVICDFQELLFVFSKLDDVTTVQLPVKDLPRVAGQIENNLTWRVMAIHHTQPPYPLRHPWTFSVGGFHLSFAST